MSYCTVDDIKLLSRLTVFKPNAQGQVTFDDATVQQFIDRADMTIRSDLSSKLDFTRVPDITGAYPTPEPIQSLSIYKATELLLVTMHGPQRTVQQITDIQWWRKQYDEIKNKIARSAVALVDVNGTTLYQVGQQFINTDKTCPAFGDTKYGDWQGIANEGKFLGTDTEP